MKTRIKQLQKRTVFVFKSVKETDLSNISDTTTSTDPTTVLTTTVTTEALQPLVRFNCR